MSSSNSVVHGCISSEAYPTAGRLRLSARRGPWYCTVGLPYRAVGRRETAELAHAAFQEVVAAFEVLGTPDKRAAFDELAGAGGQFADFDARWENAEFAWDSDMYKGAKDITTLTERIWERRLVGESVWLVKCYAAWCPACKAHMGQFFATAEKLRDEVEVEVRPHSAPRVAMRDRALKRSGSHVCPVRGLHLRNGEAWQVGFALHMFAKVLARTHAQEYAHRACA